MARPKRNRKGRFVRGKAKRRKAKRRVTKRTAVKRRKAYARRARRRLGPARTRRKAAKRGVSRRRRGVKYYAKPYKTRGRYVRNPLKIGKMRLIPSKPRIKGALVGAGGAVVADMIKATGYSLLGRSPGSVAEEAISGLIAASLTGVVSGFVAKPAIVNQMVDGAMTVTMHSLVAGAVNRVLGGRSKIGPVVNPYAGLVSKQLLPGIGGIVPEGRILPLGEIVPEGEIIPVGSTTERLSPRYA